MKCEMRECTMCNYPRGPHVVAVIWPCICSLVICFRVALHLYISRRTMAIRLSLGFWSTAVQTSTSKRRFVAYF